MNYEPGQKRNYGQTWTRQVSRTYDASVPLIEHYDGSVTALVVHTKKNPENSPNSENTYLDREKTDSRLQPCDNDFNYDNT